MENISRTLPIVPLLIFSSAGIISAQDINNREFNDSVQWTELDDFVITKKKSGNLRLSGPENAFKINQTELFKAACCNLGESFTTNPSVDVNYSDPATGAKQIKLLGLSGSYVQLLTENMPGFKGAARPYALRYVPGPWMKSISISKGASSVKNGYESMSGQIDVEYLKPDDPTGIAINAYLDSELKVEANADANFHISSGLSTEVLAHFEDRYMNHDGNNDGFTDTPDIRQLNFQNRWKYVSPHYIFHGGIGALNEKSMAGQIGHHTSNHEMPYKIDLATKRYEAYMKHAFIIDQEHNSNLAVMANGAMHDLDASYGLKAYSVKEWDAYAQVMFETDFSPEHNLSSGLSFSYDYLGQRVRLTHDMSAIPEKINDRETTAGAYVQYTWKPSEQLTAMAGVRSDWSSLHGWFATPRVNIRYSPLEILTFRASVGKGYRTVHPWAEYNYLMASSRSLIVDNLQQEAAWNYGINGELKIPVNAETIRLNAEYYYTNFLRQVVADYDSDPHSLYITNLDGKSYSHTFQIDATYESSFGLDITAAYRLNDVKSTYGGILMEKPLSSRYKALLTASFSTEMDIWQFDATLQLNGGGRMPAPYLLPDGNYSWGKRFKAFPQLNLQITRWFRHFSIYAGGENLTNFKQKNPIISSSDPWGQNFDSSMIWGPVHGAMAYIGIRFNFGKL
ncbi:MAG: TonB-dependent receptor [Muribaculaceae bacterium]|nr:TonB-dependent receptor [Muribaculaceae bacterium]